jgi:hypothetical protein
MSALPEATEVLSHAVTTILCKAGGASVAEDSSSQMPQLFSVKSGSGTVAIPPVELYKCFTDAAASLVLSESPPWLSLPNHVSSRHAVISITLIEPFSFMYEEGHPSSSSVLEKGETVWLGMMHDDGGILGLALFW